MIIHFFVDNDEQTTVSASSSIPTHDKKIIHFVNIINYYDVGELWSTKTVVNERTISDIK